MKLIIEISEKGYNDIITDSPRNLNHYERLIANGIPLPKRHGAIKDVSQIEIPMCEDRTYERWVQVAIDSAPTIIEASKEQKDDNT